MSRSRDGKARGTRRGWPALRASTGHSPRIALDALVAITCGPAWVTDLVYGDNWNVPCSYSPAAVAGYPGASVPGGFLHGLPVGISFYGGAWQDASVLASAHAFERAPAARRPPAYLPTVADPRGDAPPF